MSKPAITAVIPVHNAADRLDRVVGWRTTLDKCGRTYEILVVDDGSTDGTGEKLLAKEPRARILRHETRQGFGACLRTALAEAKHPLFFYTALDYPYTPNDIRVMLERIEMVDDVLRKQPDLVSGCRTGLPMPFVPNWLGKLWRGFWRVFAGMPIQEPAPWHGWTEFWYKSRVSWYYGVPLADVNSCFKLFRTAFLQRFPIQSDGDFVHTELVAKATFLTSIMDEVKLTPKPDALPMMGSTSADRKRLTPSRAQFAFPKAPAPPPEANPGVTAPVSPAPVADAPGSPVPAPAPLS